MRSARLPLDLAATVGLALLALVVALFPVEPWARVTVLLPAVLVLPGYAVVSALLPPGTVSASERTVYTVALSIAICVLGGLSVQLVLGLDRAVWTILLTLVTVTASVAALRRRRALPWRQRPRSPMPMLPLTSVLAIVVAVGLGAWAISIASAPVRKDRAASRFTELWVLPAKVAPPSRDAVSIGVENHQGGPVSYLVRATQHGIELANQPIRLRDGELWHIRLLVRGISRADPIQVTLLREGKVYRRAYLESGLR